MEKVQLNSWSVILEIEPAAFVLLVSSMLHQLC